MNPFPLPVHPPSLPPSLPRKLLRNGVLTLRETPAGVGRQHRSIAARVIKQVWPLLPQRKEGRNEEGCVRAQKVPLTQGRPATATAATAASQLEDITAEVDLGSWGEVAISKMKRERTANCGCLAS